MSGRASPFAPTASWVWMGLALVVLWFGFFAVFSFLYDQWTRSPRFDVTFTQIDAFALGSTPAAVRWTLASFVIYTVLLLAFVRAAHGLGLRALIGPLGPAWRQFARVSLYLLPLYALLLGTTLLSPEPFAQMSLGAWLSLLPGLLPLLFIQISAEELVFRGYLQSHIAALAKHPVFYIGIPSILFGLIHYDGTATAYTAWSYVIWAAAFGAVCADLTARSGTLGAALAVHFINNFSALLVIAADDWLYGAALYVWPTYGEPWQPWWPYEALVLLILWLIARIALRR